MPYNFGWGRSARGFGILVVDFGPFRSDNMSQKEFLDAYYWNAGDNIDLSDVSCSLADLCKCNENISGDGTASWQRSIITAGTLVDVCSPVSCAWVFCILLLSILPDSDSMSFS